MSPTAGCGVPVPSSPSASVANNFLIVSKCWRAKISVGAMNAVCSPFSAAITAATAATTVLPDPTSPCSSRFIGRAFSISLYW